MGQTPDSENDPSANPEVRTDVPADLGTVDAFGHEDYAVAAGSVLLAAQAPFRSEFR
jgi:hypothetical protein